jgi:hypothetical protein
MELHCPTAPTDAPQEGVWGRGSKTDVFKTLAPNEDE